MPCKSHLLCSRVAAYYRGSCSGACCQYLDRQARWLGQRTAYHAENAGTTGILQGKWPPHGSLTALTPVLMLEEHRPSTGNHTAPSSGPEMLWRTWIRVTVGPDYYHGTQYMQRQTSMFCSQPPNMGAAGCCLLPTPCPRASTTPHSVTPGPNGPGHVGEGL